MKPYTCVILKTMFKNQKHWKVIKVTTYVYICSISNDAFASLRVWVCLYPSIYFRRFWPSFACICVVFEFNVSVYQYIRIIIITMNGQSENKLPRYMAYALSQRFSLFVIISAYRLKIILVERLRWWHIMLNARCALAWI